MPLGFVQEILSFELLEVVSVFGRHHPHLLHLFFCHSLHHQHAGKVFSGHTEGPLFCCGHEGEFVVYLGS